MNRKRSHRFPLVTGLTMAIALGTAAARDGFARTTSGSPADSSPCCEAALAELGVPGQIPRLRLQLPPPPPLVEGETLVLDGDDLVSIAKSDRGKPQIRLSTQSHAVYIREFRKPQSGKSLPTAQEYIGLARSQLEARGLGETDIGIPKVTRIRSLHPGSAPDEVVVTFPRVVVVGGNRIRVLGPGGRIEVRLAEDGSPLYTSKVWRDIAPAPGDPSEYLPVRPTEEAYREALEQLGDTHRYRLVKAEFGYKAESGDVRQEEMGAVYRFVFQPLDGRSGKSPQRMIEISAI